MTSLLVHEVLSPGESQILTEAQRTLMTDSYVIISLSSQYTAPPISSPLSNAKVAVSTNRQRHRKPRQLLSAATRCNKLQKCTAAIRQLAYGVPADAMDEYVRIGESTAVESVLCFCGAVIDLFREEFLRAPTDADVQRLLTLHAQRGFVGMLGSLDYMHLEWKNCPVAWGKEKKPTIVLEAVASSDLWIWHAFFGMPGSNNDINVLDRSDLFIDATNTTDVFVHANASIYPPWGTLVQTISNPINNKPKYFAKKQEAARKDVERAFGVLQARWAIVKGPDRSWSYSNLAVIMKACIVLHNMIVQDERGESFLYDYDGASDVALLPRGLNRFDEFVARHQQIRCETKHNQLQHDLPLCLVQSNLGYESNVGALFMLKETYQDVGVVNPRYHDFDTMEQKLRIAKSFGADAPGLKSVVSVIN
ncbi:Nuclease HARBI1 [Phytophthora megakarya]|uniref:Nuclease HARBI1 n=1 Tax=Phytophthora megakarya TaxID=4795 RepID=A0A225WXP0_9STRA|nr:Nuclease HARBI1 [Phytophthora megakarya]